jgi:hypothetical protein
MKKKIIYHIPEEKEIKKEKIPEATLYFEKNGDSVNLMADMNTGTWYLLRFNEDGTISFYGDIPADNLGFQYTKAGCIKTTREIL